MLNHPSLTMYFVLFVCASFAGFIDSVAGGGGLITVPALLFAGLPPQAALGTNKLQASFGSFTASANYMRNRKADLRTAKTGVIFTIAGASAGTVLVQMTDPGLLKRILPFLLSLVLFYIIFSPQVKDYDRAKRMGQNLFFLIFGLSLGFYDGFFGPGTGNLWVVVFIAFLGFNIVKATAFTKIMNFTSNITALTFFIIGGNVDYRKGFIMAAGQLIGARLGSDMVIKEGNRVIKPLFILVVTIIIINLFYESFIK